MKDIPRWVVIAGGGFAVIAITYGKRLGMDINETTLTMLAGIVGTLANFLGKPKDKNDRDNGKPPSKDEENDA